VSKPFLALAVPLFLLLTACGQGGEPAWRGGAAKPAADPESVAGYLRPPSLAMVRADAGGVSLSGRAQPSAPVQLISPTGQTFDATADSAGAWTIRLPASPDVRLLALSMGADQNRVVPAQGVLALLPDGRAVQLRAGASAEAISAISDPPRLLTIDYDADGAASVAGVARPESGLSLRIDRTARAAGKADSRGRFNLVVARPLAAGVSRFEVAGESGEQAVEVPITAAGMFEGSHRIQRLAGAWRIDWVTPGGGVQTTLILDIGT
jgi:hypothetical protein